MRRSLRALALALALGAAYGVAADAEAPLQAAIRGQIVALHQDEARARGVVSMASVNAIVPAATLQALVVADAQAQEALSAADDPAAGLTEFATARNAVAHLQALVAAQPALLAMEH